MSGGLNLANVYESQGRFAEAEALFIEAIRIKRRALGNEHPDVAASFNNLAVLYKDQGRSAEAEPLYKRAFAIWEKSLGPDHPDVAASLNNLANLYEYQGRYAEAERLHKRSLAIKERSLGPDHPDVATGLQNLAVMRKGQGYCAEAEALVDRAIAMGDAVGVAAGERSTRYEFRADVRWGLGRKKEALADLGKAMDLAEQTRVKASGGERERAAAFARYTGVFEQMVSWQAVLGGTAEALAAVERSRARGLLDQMGLQGTDLLVGLPTQQAAALRQQDAQARGMVSSLQKQVDALRARRDLSDEERRRQTAELEKKLRQAQAAAADAYAAIRAASPAYRLAIGQDRKPATLEELARCVADQKALLLEYLVGEKGGYVLVISAGWAPRLEKLTVSKEQGRALGIEAGPLTAKQLKSALTNQTQTGVLQLLRGSEDAGKLKQAAANLGALWEILIPKAERAALVDKKYQRLIVIPDAALAQLPFETLVVERSDEPRYLLDVGLPIEYAPSATILVNLTQRKEQSGLKDLKDREPVLTLGDCRYPQSAGPSGEDVLTQLAARSRYGSTGGKLAPLVASAWETAWVGNNFKENGIKAAQLTGDAATEAAVRSKAPGRRVLHFACHGLVDQKYGNLFGALALTPGPNPDDPADDGFLTLKEIYELNLKGCELAILSACETNVGPEQRGEGIWSLSRGFLVAGSRRVVASEWLVNDEAAASLVSIFCHYLASAEKEGKKPDYAEALHKAKLWVRKNKDHPEWHSPYYWGTFVLIGPQ